jgi:hypothetical protein
MLRPPGWNTSRILCCACLLLVTAFPGLAHASHTLIIHVEDDGGTAVLHAQVTVITPEGEYLKTVQGPDGIYAPIALSGKVTLEIEHETYGIKYVDVNLDVAPDGSAVPEDAYVHETVRLGQELQSEAMVPAPLENDDCVNAIQVDVPSVTFGTTTDATYDPDADAVGICGPTYTTPGVWYSVIGTGNTMTAETCGDFYGYDTKVTVYCGSCGELKCVDGNDDNCPSGASPLLSSVSWCSQESAEYLILVHGFGGQTGDFELNVYDNGLACTGAVECLPLGACCLPDGSCADGLTQFQCENLGGLYQGDGAACAGGPLDWTVEDCEGGFEDISATGTQLFLGDDGGTVVPIGFTFNFWGDPHDDIGVTSNGYLTFGGDLSDFSNDPIPNTTDPNDLIAPLWDDLDPSAGGTIHYETKGTAPNRYFIAQWKNVPEFAEENDFTFEAVLFEGTNCIQFRYGYIDYASYAGDYTIGVENQDGTEGASVPATSIAPGDCISFCPYSTDPISCVTYVHLDIKPQSCPNPLNTNSRGVLPVAILGTPDFDPTSVDPTTITLEGVPPIRWSIDDVAGPFEGELCDCGEAGPDGYDDLTLKFEAQEIVGACQPAGRTAKKEALLLSNTEEKVLTLRGLDLNGAPFEGSDCVRIMYKSTGPYIDGDPSGPGIVEQTTDEIALGGTYPNPFTSSTRITFTLPQPTRVSLVVYDVAGRRVKTLVDEEVSGGSHSATWDRTNEAGRYLPAGVYFVRMSAPGFDRISKLIVVQ